MHSQDDESAATIDLMAPSPPSSSDFALAASDDLEHDGDEDFDDMEVSGWKPMTCTGLV